MINDVDEWFAERQTSASQLPTSEPGLLRRKPVTNNTA
jgi:hypothetical protein